MKTGNSLLVYFEGSRRNKPLLAFKGPLLGLAYILVLPLAGFLMLALLSGYRAKHLLHSARPA